jgi:hypothetical protein
VAAIGQIGSSEVAPRKRRAILRRHVFHDPAFLLAAFKRETHSVERARSLLQEVVVGTAEVDGSVEGEGRGLLLDPGFRLPSVNCHCSSTIQCWS